MKFFFWRQLTLRKFSISKETVVFRFLCSICTKKKKNFLISKAKERKKLSNKNKKTHTKQIFFFIDQQSSPITVKTLKANVEHFQSTIHQHFRLSQLLAASRGDKTRSTNNNKNNIKIRLLSR